MKHVVPFGQVLQPKQKATTVVSSWSERQSDSGVDES